MRKKVATAVLLPTQHHARLGAAAAHPAGVMAGAHEPAFTAARLITELAGTFRGDGGRRRDESLAGGRI